MKKIWYAPNGFEAYGDEEIKAVESCLKDGWLAGFGKRSLEFEEKISSYLTNKKIVHNILNAKQHEKEANIIAEAGKLNAVTIATNMAGRGTDIKLGGNKDFIYDGKKENDPPRGKRAKEIR